MFFQVLFFPLGSRTVCAFEPYRKFKYNGNFHIFQVVSSWLPSCKTCATARGGKQSGVFFFIRKGSISTTNSGWRCPYFSFTFDSFLPCRLYRFGHNQKLQNVVTPQRHVFSKVPNIFEVAPIVGPLGKQEFMKARKGGTQRLMDF